MVDVGDNNFYNETCSCAQFVLWIPRYPFGVRGVVVGSWCVGPGDLTVFEKGRGGWTEDGVVKRIAVGVRLMDG